ncbi:3-phosphoshikimate 1-carboxyvinyltransferase [Anaeroselena agilis]|uniref:3-phosphoshikimate 1-carboxyvinyltransferase n=1 Tax=Anaeroselena agilis TaxID=3063788 RepID=A0ABU3NWJ5_9FIRM|nr:3-phosphoshikimate 1-carboxyvinyltransferase [Selenomonadales bacterium 4137-cl]
MKEVVKPARKLAGEIAVPGDKSISHRSVMLAGLADSPVTICNFLASADCLSTVACMQALGVKVDRPGEDELAILGNGLYGLSEPEEVLDAGNSGTTIRLLTGILAGQPFFSVLSGDGSLRRRPMARVITPLSKMGCRIYGREGSRYAPLAIVPADGIHGIDYTMPVASAQVKSALLFAGMFADGPTRITEPYISRDHSERMLQTFGAKVTRSGLIVKIAPVQELSAPRTIDVPGDISSAAFWLVAATIIPGSRLRLTNVGINPTRTGIIDILRRMGADIEITNQRQAGEEPVADLVVSAAELSGTTVEGEIIPRLIDEIPVLAVAALFAKGRTVISGAEELRVKETDRLKAITLELAKMGARIEETVDGLIIDGPQRLEAAVCQSHDDHRMAMALAIAGLAAGGVEIEEAACVAISYPRFFAHIAALQEAAGGSR